MGKETFKLTQKHIKLLQRANWRMSDYETGAPEIDGKRPYGNSYVPRDVADILNIKGEGEDDCLTDEQESQMLAIHAETLLAIQIILQTKSFDTGTYERSSAYGAKWKKIDE